MLDENTLLGNAMRGNMQTNAQGGFGGLSPNASPEMRSAFTLPQHQQQSLWQRMHDRQQQMRDQNPWSNPMLMAMGGLGGMGGSPLGMLGGGLGSLIAALLARKHHGVGGGDHGAGNED